MVRMTCAVEAENYPGPPEMDFSENYGETPWKTEIEIHEIHIKPSCSLSKLPFGGAFWPIFSDKPCGRSSDCRSFPLAEVVFFSHYNVSLPPGMMIWFQHSTGSLNHTATAPGCIAASCSCRWCFRPHGHHNLRTTRQNIATMETMETVQEKSAWLENLVAGFNNLEKY